MYAEARPPRAALRRAHLSLPPTKDAERSGKNPVGRSGGQLKTLEYGGVVACPGRHVETERAGAKGREPHGFAQKHHRPAAAGRACVAVSGARAPDRSTVPDRAGDRPAGRPTNTNARQSGAAETSLAFPAADRCGGLGLAGCLGWLRLGWPLLGGCPSGRLGGWPDDWPGGLARDNTLACVWHPW
jgi:hypothetical protein